MAAGGAVETRSGQPPQISTELVRALWPMLEAVPGRLGGSPEVVRQLFLLLGKMLTSLRMVLAQQVGWWVGWVDPVAMVAGTVGVRGGGRLLGALGGATVIA